MRPIDTRTTSTEEPVIWDEVHLEQVALELTAAQLHLWLLPLEQPFSEVEPDFATLTPDEIERSQRFKFAIDSQRFQRGRALLRRVLGRYASVAPSEVRFGYAANGKPSLLRQQNDRCIEFNLSHSGACALLGVALGTTLGVDLEQERRVQDFEQIAQNQFAPAEWAQLCSLAPQRRLAGFLAGWTRKEAYVKAQGCGLAVALDSFEVSLDPDQPAALLSIEGSKTEASAWTMWGFKANSSAWAAVVAHGTGLTLRRFKMAN